MTDNTNSLVITYGEHSLDFSKLPHATTVAMLRRGVSHFLGNEQASKITAYFDQEKDEPVADTPEARAKVKAELVAKAVDAMIAGTVGVSVRGPSVDPITVIVRRLAKAEIKGILTNNGVKTPKKSDEKVTAPDGSEFTMDEFIDRRLNPALPSGMDKKTGVSHLERLTKEAKKIAAEQAKKAEKAAEAAKAEGLSAL